MRDLIVKIKTEEDEAQVEEDTLQLLDSARSTIASDGSDGSRLRLVVSRADDDGDDKKHQESLPHVVTLLSESDDSTTSGSFWPDLQVLDPDHPV